MSERLKPCPFCGAALTIRSGVNPYGRCDTEGCWMHERAVTVPLDDRRQVRQWNTRAETPQSIPSEREEIMAWLRSHDGADQRAIQNGECVRGSTMHGELRDRAGYYLEVADAISRGEHLSTRQAPIEGSVE